MLEDYVGDDGKIRVLVNVAVAGRESEFLNVLIDYRPGMSIEDAVLEAEAVAVRKIREYGEGFPVSVTFEPRMGRLVPPDDGEERPL